MTKEQFLISLKRYLEGEASPHEVEFLEAYYNAFIADDDVTKMLDGREREKLKLAIRAGIQKQIDNKGKGKMMPLWQKLSIAASVLILSTLAFYFLRPQVNQSTSNQVDKHTNILAGSNKAILTLANGNKVTVTDAHNGRLAMEGNVAVTKAANGKLSYHDATKANAGTALYNTLTTPRGGQFQLVLADGTKVWLNAASSIRFPVTFTGAKRRDVEITGEAYFEVVHNASQPFSVTANGVRVEDLGTEFNVNAYTDETAMRTTLVSGSINVIHQANQALIKPGTVAITYPANSQIKVATADIEETVAWKNGQTLFTNQDIQTIMRQISRWYNVDVVYDGQPTKRRFDGGISRRSNLDAVLKVLQLNHIKFEVNGRKITVKN